MPDEKTVLRGPIIMKITFLWPSWIWGYTHDLMTSRPLCYQPALKGFFFSLMTLSIPASIFSVRSLNNLDSSSSEVRLSFRYSVSGATRNIHKDQIDLLPHILCYFYLISLSLFPKHFLPFPLLTFISWTVHWKYWMKRLK